MKAEDELKKEPSEQEKLIKEKITLAKKLGLMGVNADPVKGYEDTEQYKRLDEIDIKLWELIK